jgi:Beta-lactamase
MRESEIRELGFGPERLSLLTAKLQKWLDRGTIPGAVVAVGRRGKLAMLSAVGFRDREERAEMASNTIFRVASSPSPSSRLQPWYWLKKAASGSGTQCRFIFLPLQD